MLTRNRIAKLRRAMLAGCTALAKLTLSHNALADLGGEKRTLNGRSICFDGLLAKGCVQRTSIALEAAGRLNTAWYCSMYIT